MAGLSTLDMCWAFTSNLEGVKTLFFNIGLVEDKDKDTKKKKEVSQVKVADNPTIPEEIPVKTRNIVKLSRTLPAYGSKKVEELSRPSSVLPFRRNLVKKEKKKEECSKTLPRNLGAEAKKVFSLPKSILKKPSTSGGDHVEEEPVRLTTIPEKGEEEINAAEGSALPNKIVFLRIDDLHIFRPGETRELVSDSSL